MLSNLHFPFEVTFGRIDNLQITIPWSDLKNSPLKIQINNVYILANPITSDGYDPELEDKINQEAKQQKLKAAEDALHKSLETSNAGYFDNIWSAIVDNIQITIKNIHVRYEDTISCPIPFGVGFTLHELSAVSTDSEFNIKIPEKSDVIYKLLKIGHFGVYCATYVSSFQKETEQETLECFANSIAKTQKVDSSKQYIMNPVTGIGKVILINRS